MRTRKNWPAGILMVLTLFSCITVNIYFPGEEVKRAAGQIVRETYGIDEEAEGNGHSSRPEPSSVEGSFFCLAAACLDPLDFQEEKDIQIDISNPALRAIRKSLKDRFPKLEKYLEKGNIGLTNDGLIAIKETEGLGLKEKAELKRLVDADNKDRESLYKEIVVANKIDMKKLPEVRGIFAKKWIEEAKEGWWYQDEKGKWVKKEKEKEKEKEKSSF